MEINPIEVVAQGMLTLSAQIRKERGRVKVKKIRKRGNLPAILYGPKIKALSLEINLREFEKIYKEAGESTLVFLKIQDEKTEPMVLIHDVKLDPLALEPIHVDFYQPSLEEEVEVTVPIIFEGEAPAVKELGGTLVKNISEVEIKALPQKLPHEIKVNVEVLKTFGEHILIKDLMLPEGVKILKDPEEVVALVASPEKVEEELEKPIEEKVEEVEKVEKKREEEELEI